MLGSTLSRDSRPYPHDRYALALEAHLSLGTGFPHFRGHLHGEGGKRPALTGIPKRNLPRLTSSFHGQKLDQQPWSIPPIAGDRRPFAAVCFEATAKYELRLCPRRRRNSPPLGAGVDGGAYWARPGDAADRAASVSRATSRNSRSSGIRDPRFSAIDAGAIDASCFCYVRPPANRRGDACISLGGQGPFV